MEDLELSLKTCNKIHNVQVQTIDPRSRNLSLGFRLFLSWGFIITIQLQSTVQLLVFEYGCLEFQLRPRFFSSLAHNTPDAGPQYVRTIATEYLLLLVGAVI